MGAGTAAASSGLEVHRYGEGLTVTAGLKGLDRGTLIHRCFEVLGARPDVRDRLAEITGVDIELSGVEQIAAAVAAFEAWLQTFQPTHIRREWPVSALDAQGSVVISTADLIVETEQGCWIIDHKSDDTDDPITAFRGTGHSCRPMPRP